MNDITLAFLIFTTAVLYSSVGHAGASGYLAAMALFGLAPEAMKPTALCLNLLVASIATARYYRAGCFQWNLFWPFVVTSIPCAWWGGYLQISAIYYKPLVGLVLIYAAIYFVRQTHQAEITNVTPPAYPVCVVWGAILGFLSGLTGVGGGIFLSPLLLYFRWAPIRAISGVASAFILVNSLAGMLGFLAQQAPVIPKSLPIWCLCAIAGGSIGSELGARRLKIAVLKRILAVALLIAGGKMLLTF